MAVKQKTVVGPRCSTSESVVLLSRLSKTVVERECWVGRARSLKLVKSFQVTFLTLCLADQAILLVSSTCFTHQGFEGHDERESCLPSAHTRRSLAEGIPGSKLETTSMCVDIKAEECRGET